jgi:hypothetical protein
VTLAVALRGPDAAGVWAEAVGPEDPAVARQTDPDSLRAALGVDRARNLVAVSRTAERGRRDAEAWFGPDALGEWPAPGIGSPAAAAAAAWAGIEVLVARAEEAVVVVLRAGLTGGEAAAVLAAFLQRGLRLTAARRGGVDPRALPKLGLPAAWAGAAARRQGSEGTDDDDGSAAAPLMCVCLVGENGGARARAAAASAAEALEAAGRCEPAAAVAASGASSAGASPRPSPSPPTSSPGRPAHDVVLHGAWVCTAGPGEAGLRFRVHLGLDEAPEPVDQVAFAQRVAGAPAKWYSSPTGPQTVVVALLPDAADDPAAVRDLLTTLLGPAAGGGLAAELVGLRRAGWLPRFAAEELCPYGKGDAVWEEWVEAAEAGPLLLLALRLAHGAPLVRRVRCVRSRAARAVRAPLV